MDVEDPEEIARFVTTVNRMQQLPGDPEPEPNKVKLGRNTFHYELAGKNLFLSRDPGLSKELSSLKPEATMDLKTVLPALDTDGSLLLVLQPSRDHGQPWASRISKALGEKAIMGVSLSRPDQHAFLKAQIPFENPREREEHRGLLYVRTLRLALKLLHLLLTGIVIALLIREGRGLVRERKLRAG